MLQKILCLCLFMGIFGSSYGLLPSRCVYSQKERAMTCKMARLRKRMGDLVIPVETKKVLLTNNELDNAVQIQSKIQKLSALKVLDISYNNMQDRIKDLLKGNGELEEFYVRNNKFRSIHETTFMNNPLLMRVDLSNNRISAVPPRLFASNPRLVSVEMWANEITTLPEELFRHNKNVETVNLSWNRLTDIPESFFRGLRKLKRVMLWKNQLVCLYSSMFLDNIQLQAFHVAINHIKKVPDKIFDNNPELEDVRMWSNKLECIPKKTFDNNARLEYVNMMLGNEGLDFGLQQRFSKNGKKDMGKMARELALHGSVSCTGAPCEWNPETETMDCSGRGLTDIYMLRDVCEKVRNLNLNDNKLRDSELLAPVLEHMTELRELEIQENEMKGIKEELFKSNPQLTSVDFSRNKIDYVPENLFDANSILRRVNLADNEIKNVPDNLLSENPEVSEVDISRNQLEEISKEVFSRSRMLTSAKLAKNRIKSIDQDAFRNNEKLREIDLEDNHLEGVMFAATFEYAPDLERIHLKGNRLQNVKKSAANGREQDRVIELELSYNKLDEFPSALIEKRPKLQQLILDHNRISVIPEGGLSGSTELKEIDLAHNRLIEVSNKTFSRNTKLEMLRLDNNALTRLDSGLLSNNPSLRFFSANGNKIYFVSEDLFINNFNLEEIKLSDNAIKRFPEDLFRPIGPSLRFVTLSKNLLETLPPQSFYTNDNLEHICLYGNELSGLAKPADIAPDELREGDSKGIRRQGAQFDENFVKVASVRKESGVNNFFGFEDVKRFKEMIQRQYEFPQEEGDY